MSKTTKQTMTAADTPGVPHMMQIEIRNWLAIRKRAARKIDPETAEVDWSYAQTLDPYGIHPELPEELQQVGREYFARSPGSDVWVWFGDLARATRDALWEKHRDKLAFPAGLPLSWLEKSKKREPGNVIETHEHVGDFKEW